jgi:serine/threonine-protein kinase PknG
MKCRQPGCTGTIVDGYCDVCGMPGQSMPRQSMPVGAGREGAPPAAVASGRCRQPGCNGQIFDGYCDVCGSPVQQDAPVAAVVSTTRTRMSAHLGSTAFGSARVTSFGTESVRRAVVKDHESGRIGAGLTKVPPAPALDPAKAVLPHPEVPLDARVCARCGGKVGQGAKEVESRSEGFCPSCGAPYSFSVKLSPGDLVAGQYEVVGALAHGGMGWVYLAKDRNVSGRWVVLKGLLNTGDADARDAAIGEQRFLARVQHPAIVEIYNFVTHDGAGYIVMEYVGGRSLKQLLKQRLTANHGTSDPLPVEWSLAFLIELLPAFSYLHSLGLLYCDFKPDNAIQVGDSVKLIDLGGVRHAGDDESPIYGTVGFQAPEVPTAGPSVASDIFTIGRTLLVLSADVPGYQSTYEFSVPPAEELPAFAAQDSLYRLLLKCCAANPNDRFATAEELRLQMLGVLREVVASQRPGVGSASASSALFEAPSVAGQGLAYQALPRLRPDPEDPQAAFLERVANEPAPIRLTSLGKAPQSSIGVLLARGAAALELGQLTAVTGAWQRVLDTDPWQWRGIWLAGLGALAAKDYAAAQSAFNAVYGQLPGELAPKLALAVACELGGEYDLAEVLYRICASTDAAYVTPAAFGLARIGGAREDHDAALAALAMVPITSRGYPEALRQRAWELMRGAGDPVAIDAALAAAENAKLDEQTLVEHQVVLLRRAIRLAGEGQACLRRGAAVSPMALVEELAGAYRRLGGLQSDPAVRAGYLDLATSLRPWSLV